MTPIYVTDLGTMAYDRAWALQRRLVEGKQSGARLTDHLLVVEHPTVITVGRHGNECHVLASAERLRQLGVPVYRVERAGDVTVHTPGQLVAYPILDLRRFGREVRGYVRRLLATVVAALEPFGVPAEARLDGATGVWVALPGRVGGQGLTAGDGRRVAKIASLGVRIERWISCHGVALNVSPDLSAFQLVVPCGLAGVRVTSLSQVLGRSVSVAEVKPLLVAAFERTFGVQVVDLPALAMEAAR